MGDGRRSFGDMLCGNANHRKVQDVYVIQKWCPLQKQELLIQVYRESRWQNTAFAGTTWVDAQKALKDIKETIENGPNPHNIKAVRLLAVMETSE
jgi:hypothetical protein